MTHQIRSSRDLSPEELIKMIEELNLEKLGLMELKTVEPKEGEPQPSHFYQESIRRKLYDFCVVKRETPTLKALLRALKKEIKFKGSTRSLRKLLKKEGFNITPQEKKPKKHHTEPAKQCCCRSKKHKKTNKKITKKGEKKDEEQKK